MLGDNLEVLLRGIGVNELPKELQEKNKVSMVFHKELYSLFHEGIQNVSYLFNAVKRMTDREVTCELRECVDGTWYRTLFKVTQEDDACRVSLEVVGKEEYTPDEGFVVRGEG